MDDGVVQAAWSVMKVHGSHPIDPSRMWFTFRVAMLTSPIILPHPPGFIIAASRIIFGKRLAQFPAQHSNPIFNFYPGGGTAGSSATGAEHAPAGGSHVRRRATGSDSEASCALEWRLTGT